MTAQTETPMKLPNPASGYPARNNGTALQIPIRMNKPISTIIQPGSLSFFPTINVFDPNYFKF